jgi:aspartyl/asparaginyl beta-hydroxylase (cupin superfamily)
LQCFIGSCEPLVPVDVKDLITWIDGINRATWPDWGKGSFRPAVVNYPDWENLTEHTARIVSELLALFPGCTDTYRSITTIHPGDYVPPHTDTLVPGWMSRIHVPILTNPGALFIMDDVEHHLDVGMSYQVNPGKPHAVANRGDCTRIHLMFDVIQ